MSTPTETSQADMKRAATVEKPALVHLENGEETVADGLPPNYFRSMNFIGTMVAAGASYGSGIGGYGLAAPILGVINADIGPSPYLLWVALGYTLPLAVGLLLVGRLSDLFGRRYFFMGGSILGLIGAIVSATASNIGSLIGGSVLIGFAASAQLSVTYVIGELVPMKRRFLANASLYIWVIPFTCFGPAISYAFVIHANWRGCYYLIIALNAFTAILWTLFYHPPTFHMKHRHQTRMDLIKSFDYVGLLLFIGGLILFLIGLSWGGNLYPWKSAHVISTIVVGAIIIIAFILWEVYAKVEEPLVPVRLVANNLGWVALIFVLAIVVTVYYAFLIIWPSMVFGIYADNQVTGSWLSCVTGAGTNTGGVIMGLLARRLGNQKWQLVAAVLLGGSFLGSVACATPDNLTTVCVLLAIGNLFLGYIEAIGLVMVGLCITDQKDIGVAVGLAGAVRSTVSTIGVAIYSVILTNRLSTTIPALVPKALIGAGLPVSSVPAFLEAYTIGTPAAFATVKGLTPSILAAGARAYKIASAEAYSTVFYSTIAFSAVALILATFTPNAQKLMTGEVSAALYKQKPTAPTTIVPKTEDHSV